MKVESLTKQVREALGATRELESVAHRAAERADLDKLRKRLEDGFRELGGTAAERADVEKLRRRLDEVLRDIREELGVHEQRVAAKERGAAELFQQYLDLATTVRVGGVEVLKQDLSELTKSLERERERRAELETALGEETKKRVEVQRELVALRLTDTHGLVARLDERERELASRAAKVKQAEVLELRNAELEKELAVARTELATRAEATRGVARLEQLQLELQEREDDLQRSQENYNRASDQINKLRTRLSRLESELAKARDELHESHVATDRLNQEHEQERSQREKREALLENLRAELWDLGARHDALIDESRAAQERFRAAERDVERLRDELANNEKGLRARIAAEERARFHDELSKHEAQANEQRRELRDLLDERSAEIAELTRGRAELERELQLHRTQELSAIVKQRAELEQKVAELSGRIAALAKQVEDGTSERTRLEGECANLQARVGPLRDEIHRLEEARRRLVHVDLDREERLGKLATPFFSKNQVRKQVEEEASWLDAIGTGIRDAGFVFHDRLLYAFHTSLKNARYSPLTMLAGISGTGKSELPRLYADIGGLRFLNMAVQPSWDSPEDLFGFFNYTEGRYRATDLVRVLYQVASKTTTDPLNDQLALVLLDEMNIARVEYYFAELLSKLETRRSLERTSKDWARAAVTVDLGTSTEQLFLDHNLLFVGTMNEDESTLTLSDKVKDRAQVITFPSPKEFHGAVTKPVQPRAEHLARESWESWQHGAALGSEYQQALERKCRDFNEALQAVGRAIGHRVFQAIVQYVAAYPRVGDEERARRDAESDVFAQKLLPKVVGIETRTAQGSECLDAIEALLPDDLRAAFERGRSGDYFVWEGSRAIYEVGA